MTTKTCKDRHPHNNVCPPIYKEVKDVETDAKLLFEDESVPVSQDMPDLRVAFAERRKKIQAMDELEWIEDRLRREDEIREILKLSGMSHTERRRRLSVIEETARDLKSEFKAMICKLTTLDSKVDALVDSAREYEKSVMYKPGVENRFERATDGMGRPCFKSDLA